MAIEAFPPLETADEYGLLALGGDLSVESLLLSYRNGIFPWPTSEVDLIPWFAPKLRCILKLENFHISKSLLKLSKRGIYTFAVNRDFPAVIKYCANVSNRTGESGTWITQGMIDAYIDLHKAGYAHSIECYRKSSLVGGLYGVSIGHMFAGESMFHLESNTSKLSLLYLVELLRLKDVKWIDCQQLTPLLASFGAEVIFRDEFMKMLGKAVGKRGNLFCE